jgi:tape measure domain-containing protein
MSRFKIEVDVDANKGVASVRALGGAFTRAGTAGRAGFKTATTGLKALKSTLSGTVGLVTKLSGGIAGMVSRLGRGLIGFKSLAATAFVGWGMKRLHDGFVATGAAMDELKLSLDTITKGKGAEWFEKLNTWALKMPVNTRRAIDIFTQSWAMGLKMTTEKMTTLVDTVGALGKPEALGGIAMAMGQIMTKGRVATEELLQLAERGVPVFEILRKKMGLTKAQLGDIGRQGLDAGKTIEAIFAGLAERFGGQSSKIQNKWRGLTESLKSYWTEFQRMVMAAGVMAHIETGLKNLLARVDELYQNGRLQQWAQTVADKYVEVSNRIMELGRSAWAWAQTAGTYIQANLVPAMQTVADQAHVWWLMNEDLVKSQFLDWMAKAATKTKAFFTAVNRIIKDGKLEEWAGKTFYALTNLTDGLVGTIDLAKDLKGWMTELADSFVAAYLKIERLWKKLDNFARQDFKGKMKILFTGTGSTERPLSEKLAEMQGKVGGFSSAVASMGSSWNLDMTGISSGIGMFQDVLVKQVQRLVDAEQYAGSLNGNIGWNSDIFRQQAQNQVKGARAGLSTLVNIMGPSAGGSAAPAAASSRSVTVGELHVHLPAAASIRSDTDWREVTRRYIVPELEAIS